MSGVSVVFFNLNTGIGASGTVSCNGSNYNIAAILFQAAVTYSSAYSYVYPAVTLAIFPSYGPLVYYNLYWSTDLGSGNIHTQIAYTTYNSITGWWLVMAQGSNSYYLLAVTSSGLNEYTAPAAAGYGNCQANNSPPSITGISSTDGQIGLILDGNTYYINPSIAMEVHESTSGNFLTDNPNLDVEANVAQSGYYDFANSSSAGSQYFQIGQNSPPSTVYASGGSGGGNYMDEFGTKTGIQNRMSSEYDISNAVVTRTAGTDLPGLNTLNFYLTMVKGGSGKGTVSPVSGWHQAGSIVTITATAASGCNTFEGWFGSGTGSYSGSNNPAYPVMDGNITEIGRFLNACTPTG